MSGVGSIPLDENYKPVLALKDDVSGNVYPVHIGSLVTGSDGKTYALLDTSATISPAANQRVNTHSGDIVSGSFAAGALADGADVAQGTTTQTKATDGSATSWSVIQLLKGLVDKFISGNLTVFPGNTVNTSPWLVSEHDGTNKANNLAATAASNAANAQSARLIAGAFAEVAGQAAGAVTSTSTPIILSTDVSNFRSWSFHMTGTWSMTLQVQFSNDNVNWQLSNFTYINSTGAVSTITANGLSYGDILGRYMRIIPSAFVSNASGVGTLELWTNATPPHTMAVGQSGAWTVNNSSDITVLASAAQTTTQTQADQTNNNFRGLKVVLDMTNAGTGSVTLEIDGKDVASGKYYAILTGAAVTSNSTNIYTVYPGLTAAANVTVTDVLPHTWRIKVVANNANSATYSVGASYL